MSYSTIDDIKQRLTKQSVKALTTARGTSIPSDDVSITDIIAIADSIINSYISMRYILPTTTIPIILRKLSTDIACYILLQRVDMAEAIADVAAGYVKALEMLDNISKGLLNLPLQKLGQTFVIESFEPDMAFECNAKRFL